jgi:putative Holliday junction resolvase
MAEEVIRQTVTKKKDRKDKGLVDQISACIILQEYMGFL